MGATLILKADRQMAFDGVRAAHAAMLGSMPNYKESLSTDDPEGYFTIPFRDRVPPPPDAESIELQHFGVTSDLGKNWKVASTNFQQFLQFMAAPQRRGAEVCAMLVEPRLTDPETGGKFMLTIYLPESVDAGSRVRITFFDDYTNVPADFSQRRRCVDAMLRPVFPDLSVTENGKELSVRTSLPAQTVTFAQQHQTFRGEVLLPWPQTELLPRLPSLFPAEWNAKPQIQWIVSYSGVRGTTPAQYREGWEYIHEHFDQIPKGEVSIDFALKSIEGLEMIRSGRIRKKGVLIVLGVVTWGSREWANLAVRVFSDRYELEVHTRASVEEILPQVEAATGVKFEPISQGRVV